MELLKGQCTKIDECLIQGFFENCRSKVLSIRDDLKVDYFLSLDIFLIFLTIGPVQRNE